MTCSGKAISVASCAASARAASMIRAVLSSTAPTVVFKLARPSRTSLIRDPCRYVAAVAISCWMVSNNRSESSSGHAAAPVGASAGGHSSAER